MKPQLKTESEVKAMDEKEKAPGGEQIEQQMGGLLKNIAEGKCSINEARKLFNLAPIEGCCLLTTV